jgi:putative membrane protein
MKSSTLALGVFSLAAMIAAGGPAFAQSTVTAADRAFLMSASQANIGEIGSGKIAEKMGVSPDTRSLGKRFADNHSANQTKLVLLAKKLNVMLPMHASASDMMDMAKLETMSGSSFDSMYIAVEEKGHMKNISAFKKEAMSSKNPTIVAYVKASIPVLEEHLIVATDDAAKMKRMGTMGAMDNPGMSSGSMSSGSMSSGAMHGSAQSPISSGQPGTPASTGAGGTTMNPPGASGSSASGANANGAGPNGPTGGGAGSVPQPGTPPQR